jgi:hypothetical protein
MKDRFFNSVFYSSIAYNVFGLTCSLIYSATKIEWVRDMGGFFLIIASLCFLLLVGYMIGYGRGLFRSFDIVESCHKRELMWIKNALFFDNEI